MGNDVSPGDVLADFIAGTGISLVKSEGQLQIALSAGAGSLVLIGDSTAGGDVSSFDFTSISQSYKHLFLVVKTREDWAGLVGNCNIRLNGDSGSNYDELESRQNNATQANQLDGSPTSTFQGVANVGSNATAGHFGHGTAWILDYTATNKKGFLSHSVAFGTEGTASTYRIAHSGGTWRGTSSVTRVTVSPANGTVFKIGSRVSLYGVN